VSQDLELEQRLRSAIARVSVPDRAFRARMPRSVLSKMLVGGGVIVLFVAALGVGQLLTGYRSGPAASTADPSLAPLPSTITSAQAIASVRGLGDPVGRVDRIDAKLMTLEEYLRVAGPIRVLPGDPRSTDAPGIIGFAGDPSTRYVWVVAVSGEVWPQPRVPISWGNPPFATLSPNPAPSPTPYPPYRWGMFLVDAARGTRLAVGDAGIAEGWPAVFDRLPNHAAVAANATPGDAVAAAACATTGYDGAVVGAFRVRAEQLAIQDETPRGSPTGPHPMQSQFRAYAPDTLIVLCYYDGPIAAPGGPPGQGSTFRPYDRYAVAVDNTGRAILLVAGRRDTLTVGPHMPGTR
jgi:hypothetical protein